MAKQWYIIHTYSGFEDRVQKTLEQRIEALGMQEFFGEVQVPTETVVEVKNGKKREVRRKFFPGYVLVKMVLNDRTMQVINNIQNGDVIFQKMMKIYFLINILMPPHYHRRLIDIEEQVIM